MFYKISNEYKAGCYFFNPIFDPPVGRSEDKSHKNVGEYIPDFFNDKPTFRKLTSQVPYLQSLTQNKYIVTSKMQQEPDLQNKFQQIKGTLKIWLFYKNNCNNLITKANVNVKRTRKL